MPLLKGYWSRQPKGLTGAPLLTVESDSEFDVDKLPVAGRQCGQQTWQTFSANRERFRVAARMKCHPRFTWLSYKNGAFGCCLCAAVGFDTQWGNYSGSLKLCNIQQHTVSAQHVNAEHMLGDPTTPSVYKAPSRSEFAKVWRRVRTGPTGGEFGNQQKARNMEFCLAEAVRERHRRFLASACTVSMAMDARQGRLLLRFSGTEPQTLQVRKGTLGLERDYGSGAEACAHAVKVMVERFCSPGVCHPAKGAQAVSLVSATAQASRRNAADVAANHRAAVVVHDHGGCAALDDSGRGARLLENIKETMHLAVADGAPDGQIAIDYLRREGFWRNLIARHWDQAHGARRITQRPWNADAETHEIQETLVTGSHSLTMLFENSPALRGYLKSNIDKYCGGAEVATDGLSSGIRKHRYDSTQMPMIRTVLRTRANTATAVQIARAFKGDHSALCCEYYLLYVSGTVGMRRLLLFSMMTDAGDEVVVVIYASRVPPRPLAGQGLEAAGQQLEAGEAPLARCLFIIVLMFSFGPWLKGRVIGHIVFVILSHIFVVSRPPSPKLEQRVTGQQGRKLEQRVTGLQ